MHARSLQWLSTIGWLLLFPCAGRSADLAEELANLAGKDRKALSAEFDRSVRLLRFLADRHLRPWNVWKFSTAKNETRYVIFARRSMLFSSGNSEASMLLLSADGKLIHGWEFSLGLGVNDHTAEFSFNQAVDAQMVTITTVSAPIWRTVVRQYYALVDDQWHLVRLEDSQGHLLRNSYHDTMLAQPGGKVANRKAEEWTTLLKSAHPAQRLAAFTYLSGWHRHPDRPPPEMVLPISESIEDAKMVRAVRNDAATLEAIATDRQSANEWLKEAASLLAELPKTD